MTEKTTPEDVKRMIKKSLSLRIAYLRECGLSNYEIKMATLKSLDEVKADVNRDLPAF